MRQCGHPRRDRNTVWRDRPFNRPEPYTAQFPLFVAYLKLLEEGGVVEQFDAVFGRSIVRVARQEQVQEGNQL